jgi:3-methyl-2-oxobutanoate hydroxymethyltransferase
MAKRSVNELQRMKREGQKITEALVFDVTMTKIFERAGADILLVGDSYTNYLLGLKADEATVDGMVLFARGVAAAAERALVTVDLPSSVCEAGPKQVLNAARRYREETKADFAKIDIPSGDDLLVDETRAVVEAGLAADVRVRFRTDRAQANGVKSEHERVVKLAYAVTEAGASLIELYFGTPELYAEVSKALPVPVMGGRWSTGDADGKIFVYPNLIGYRPGDLEAPERTIAGSILEIVNPFLDEVRRGSWEATDNAMYPENRRFPR